MDSSFFHFGDTKITANLAREKTIDLGMSGNRRDAIGIWIVENAVFTALSDKHAPVLCQIAQKIDALHTILHGNREWFSPDTAAPNAVHI